jgi:hypothetical protein
MMFNRFMRLAAAALVLVASGCAAAPSFDLSVTRLAAGPNAFEISSGFTAPANLIVRDQAGWEALWNTVYANVTPRPPLPPVDFTQSLIVARAMGPRPTGGFDVVVSGLIRQGGEFVVQVRETVPGPGCGVTLALTSPVDIARIARSDDPIKFAVATTTRSCPQ